MWDVLVPHTNGERAKMVSIWILWHSQAFTYTVTTKQRMGPDLTGSAGLLLFYVKALVVVLS